MTASLPPRTVEWIGGLDGHVALIDQTRLPERLVFVEVRDPVAMWDAIKRLVVRGAPAIGVAAAFGAVLGVRPFRGDTPGLLAELDHACEYLKSSRPTAVNLAWALERVRRRARDAETESSEAIKLILLNEAQAIRDEDEAMCRAIGRHGLGLIHDGSSILTHCNAGSLATAFYGTALAPIYAAHERGLKVRVLATETRPLFQGARLTIWELHQAGIDVTLLTDGMVASLLQSKAVDLVITGADRIAANGDTANKIGTYGIALAAHAHGVPFYIAAPSSTFDLALPDGSAIPIEFRDPDEIRRGFGRVTTVPDIPCYSPAFDITPARYIRGILTERGIIQPVERKSIESLLKA